MADTTGIEIALLTFEDYLAMPEMQRRYEILHGELVMSPAPSMQHQWIADDFTQFLKEFVLPRGLGIVLSAPVDVLISREPLQTRQPDVLFVSTERSGFRTKDDLADIHLLETAPELVMEVLSPSNRSSEIGEKLHDYASIGVNEVWHLRSKDKSIQVLRLTSSGYETVAIFVEDEIANSEVLKGFSIRTNRVFS